jgi:hypothetical protein
MENIQYYNPTASASQFSSNVRLCASNSDPQSIRKTNKKNSAYLQFKEPKAHSPADTLDTFKIQCYPYPRIW